MTSPIIGICDSGSGGQVVAQFLESEFSRAKILVELDRANAPFGSKSVAQLEKIGSNLVAKLIHRGAEIIVMACHTISSTCLPAIQAKYTLPIISANEVLVAELSNLIRNQELINKSVNTIGILATQRTTDSSWFPKNLKIQYPDLKVNSIACPELATAIDQQNGALINDLLDDYLAQLPLESLDALLLACTHYPVVKKQIATKLPRQIPILDTHKQLVIELTTKFTLNEKA